MWALSMMQASERFEQVFLWRRRESVHEMVQDWIDWREQLRWCERHALAQVKEPMGVSVEYNWVHERTGSHKDTTSTPYQRPKSDARPMTAYIKGKNI